MFGDCLICVDLWLTLNVLEWSVTTWLGSSGTWAELPLRWVSLGAYWAGLIWAWGGLSSSCRDTLFSLDQFQRGNLPVSWELSGEEIREAGVESGGRFSSLVDLQLGCTQSGIPTVRVPVLNLDLFPICPVVVGEAAATYTDLGTAAIFSHNHCSPTQKVLGPSPRWAFLDSAASSCFCASHFTALPAGGLDPARFSLLAFFMLYTVHLPPKNSKLLVTSALISALVIFVVVLALFSFMWAFILWLSHF